jgi:hypothetical protein
VKIGFAKFVAVAGAVAWASCSTVCLAAQNTATIDLAKDAIGAPPANFEFARTGEGSLGDWRLVRDPASPGGAAIEHVSTDTHDDRYSLAIYKPLVAENVEVSVGFRIMSGSVATAGIAIGLRNPDSYYAIGANALEHRVDLFLVANGKRERIDGSEAEVTRDRWHVLGVKVNDDHFAVSFDNTLLFTTFDRTRMKDGRVALWTQEDNVTRFDNVEIRRLPPTEWR